jgi:hypothetical protein
MRAPLVFDALSEDEDEDPGEDGTREGDGSVLFHARVTPSLPAVFATATTFEQEDGARPSLVTTRTAPHADEDVEFAPSIAESAVAAAPVGSSAAPSGLLTGDRPSSAYSFSNPVITNNRSATGDTVEEVSQEGNQFLVEGSVKVLKDFLRAHATAADGDWQTLVEKADLRNFALATYERREADTVVSGNAEQCSDDMEDGVEDDGSKGCGGCMDGLLRKLRRRADPYEAADE